jgi:hypothetical protein
MAQTRFTCTLTRADEPACQSYARVTIMDSEGAAARGCPRHAAAALDGIAGAHVDWTDSKGLNEWERKALELSEERNKIDGSHRMPNRAALDVAMKPSQLSLSLLVLAGRYRLLVRSRLSLSPLLVLDLGCTGGLPLGGSSQSRVAANGLTLVSVQNDQPSGSDRGRPVVSFKQEFTYVSGARCSAPTERV